MCIFRKGLMLGIYELLVLITLCNSQTSITVNTKVGNIMGFQEYTSIDGQQKITSKFLGIPYAESTAGKNRFQKPIPKAPFGGTFDARQTPMACYQYSNETMNIYRKLVPGFSEDCLSLNIYVPHSLKSNDLMPVMIWIHGGGFVQGAASNYPSEVLSSFGNVIVVTVNYRVAMFGFLQDTNGDFPGNQGLWDQHLAIKWVHDNIENFYGYKDEITIFGESAGAASVLFQALHPGNMGLFKRVIAASGSPLASWAVLNVSNYDQYLIEMGCSVNSVTCMQRKDPMSILTNTTTFGPVLDGDFLAGTPLEIVQGKLVETEEARAFYASLDIMVGVNNMDGALNLGPFGMLLGHTPGNLNYSITRQEFLNKMVPWFVNTTQVPKDDDERMALTELFSFAYTNWQDPDDLDVIRNSVADMSNDAFFFAPGIQTAKTHAKLREGKTYFYEFALQTEKHILPLPSWLKGSNHADDIPYLFGTPLRENATLFGGKVNFTSEEKRVSRATMTLLTNFAKSGNPNTPMDAAPIIHTTWPEYTLMSQRYFQISNQMSATSVMERFHPRRMHFWTELIPKMNRLLQPKKQKIDIFHFDPTMVG